jgi:hypothetical protein
MSKLKLEDLAVESFDTGALNGARGTVRGMGGIVGGTEPNEVDNPSDDFPSDSGFNSCETCIFNTCGTCPDQA